MNKLILTLISLFFLVTLALSAQQDTTAWKYAQAFEVEKPGLAKLELPLATLRASQAELEDVRLYDPTGKEVAYRVEHTMPVVQTKLLKLNQLDITLKKDSTEILLENPFEQLAGFEIVTSVMQHSTKPITVRVSNDRANWRVLFQGRPFRTAHRIDVFENVRQDASNHLIRLDEGAAKQDVSEKYLLIEIDDRLSQRSSIDCIRLIANPQVVVPARPLPEMKVERQERQSSTLLSLHLGTAHVDLEKIMLSVADPIFQRSVDLSVLQLNQGELQTKLLKQPSTIERSPAGENVVIRLNRTIDSSEIEMEIDNLDSPPLTIQKIEVYYHPIYLVFSAEQTGVYTLRTGNPTAHKPVYDIANASIASLLKNARDVGSATVLKQSSDYKMPSLQLGQEGTPIDLFPWKYSRAIRVEREGWQQVTLDPLALAHCNDGLYDVRIVSDKRQIPYLVRRHASTEFINLEATEEREADHAKISSWKIKLPYQGLPVHAVSFRSTEPVFERSLTLYEKIEYRGRESEWVFGNATWLRNIGSPQDTFRFSLHRSHKLRGDTLWLDVSRGDNPPLPLTDFKAEIPVVSLLFWGKQGQEYELYYGYPEANRPKYDMTLVASELWNIEPFQVTLGEEKTLKKNLWGSDKERSTVGHWAFWIVLAAVMLILLALLSRLISTSGDSLNPPRSNSS